VHFVETMAVVAVAPRLRNWTET